MKRKNQMAIISILFLVYVLSTFSPVFGQLQGLELYNKLREEQRSLLKYEGDRTVRWTPNGEAYIVRKEGIFKKIDLQTGAESNLFDDDRVITAYNELMDETGTRLPFTRFNFIEDGEKILVRRPDQ